MVVIISSGFSDSGNGGISTGTAVGLIVGLPFGCAILVMVIVILSISLKRKKQKTIGKSVASQDTERENVGDGQTSAPSNDPQAEPTRQAYYSENPYDISYLPRYEPPEVPETPEAPPPTYHPPRKNTTTN